MAEREGLIKTDELIELTKTVSEEGIVQLKKQELDYLVARVGLQGTLWGAWACLVVIVLIVLSPTFTSRNIIEGWQIVAIVAVMVVSVVFLRGLYLPEGFEGGWKVRIDGLLFGDAADGKGP